MSSHLREKFHIIKNGLLYKLRRGTFHGKVHTILWRTFARKGTPYTMIKTKDGHKRTRSIVKHLLISVLLFVAAGGIVMMDLEESLHTLMIP